MNIGLIDVDGHNFDFKDFRPRKGFTCSEYFKEK